MTGWGKVMNVLFVSTGVLYSVKCMEIILKVNVRECKNMLCVESN